MAGRRRSDPLEGIIEASLRPGSFISWRDRTGFSAGLDEAARSIKNLIATDPTRAVALYEAFIAGCHEKAEEIDDSGGDFGSFVEKLFLAWIRARQAATTDPQETMDRLLAWIDSDPYGFCRELERSAVTVLDRRGRGAFEQAMRCRFEAAGDRKPGEDRSADYARNRWGAALKGLYAETKAVSAYVALCEKSELTDEDCQVLAEILQTQGKLSDALGWVERGLEIRKRRAHRGIAGGYKLPDVKRSLLRKLGRGTEALDSAWAQYQSSPNEFTYEELMRYIPRAEKTIWHERAMEAAADGELSSVIGLWLKTKEIERLAAHLGKASDAKLEELSHYVTEPAAKRLARSHPDVAAKLHRALAVRIVDAGKSKYYDAALSHLRDARRCYEKAGRSAEWQALVTALRDRHRRKTGFLDGFDRLLAGEERGKEPSFLERARKRWSTTGEPQSAPRRGPHRGKATPSSDPTGEA